MDYSIHYKTWHDETDEHALRMAHQQKAILSPHIPENRNAKVLDIGCGFGFSLLAMQQLGFNDLCGIEISPQQAAVARRRFSNIILTKDTIKELQELRCKFDFVILFDVLEHIPSFQQIPLLQAIENCLADNGKMILTTPNANSILASRWRYIDFTHLTSFTEHSLSFVLASAGFGEINIDNNKGLGKFPKSFWRKGFASRLRRWLVRYIWLQVYKAEISWENIDTISFELNLIATACKISNGKN